MRLIAAVVAMALCGSALAGKVEVGADHALQVDAAPFFVLGVFDVYPLEELQKVAELGFNTVEVPYKRMDPRFPDESQGTDLQAYLDEAQRLGLKVIPWFGGYDDTYVARTLPLIEKYKDHPALMAWYTIDEPSGFKWGADKLETVYREFKKADPAHPVVSVFCSLPADAKYRDTIDLFGIDPYPVGRNKRPDNPAQVVEETQLAFEITGNEKPIWACPQAFGKITGWPGAPTGEQYRLMSYLFVMHGVKGLLAYTWRFAEDTPDGLAIGNTPDLREAARQTNLEMARLAPSFLGEKRRTFAEGAVHAAEFVQNDRATILVANTTAEKVAPRLNLSTTAAGTLLDGQPLTEESAAPVVTLEPWGVRVLEMAVPAGTATVLESVDGNVGQAALKERKP